jgi:hypothetical protein
VTRSPARAFAVLALLLGAALAATLPPTAAPDEGLHLARVWTLTQGRLLPPGPATAPAWIPQAIPALHFAVNGATVPASVVPRSPGETLALAAAPVAPGRTVRLLQGGAYPPVVYLPAVLGVGVGRLLGLPVGALVWLARAANLAAWTALTAWAIRICPLRRWSLVLLGLMPMSLATAASVSADGLTNALAWLFLAVVLRSAFGRSEPIGRGELGGLLGAALGLGLAKAGYQPLVLSALAIPPARCGGRGRWLALATGVALAASVPAAGWLAAMQLVAPPPPAPGADPAAQLHYLLAHPTAFAVAVARTVRLDASAWARTFVGVLGPLTVALPASIYWGWAVAGAAVLAADGPSPEGLSQGRRWLLAAAFAGCAGLVLVSAYLGWNPVGAGHVRGVQGRYFLPAAPALVAALPARRAVLPADGRLAVLVFAAASGLAAVVAVVGRYYTL